VVSEAQPEPQQAPTTCWWHPDRQTGLRCTRCERWACPDCLREAAVGYQCIDCVAAARREEKARSAVTRGRGFGARTVAGARVTDQVVVTPLLIVLNGLIFVATAAEAGSVMDNQSSTLFLQGALWSPLVAAGEWWRLITSAFLHIGPFHLLMNMLALWFLGRDLEQLLGKARFLALYGVSLLGGGVAVYLFEDVQRWTAGASGAIYGLLGAILVAAIRLRLDLTFIVVIIGINLVISFRVEGISWLGHLGGFAVGTLVTVALVYAPARIRTPVQVGTIALVVAALIAMFLVRDAQLIEQFGIPV
jgi:membrane associated rhomboid family serine protease